jgi:diguanylate cyclase (GGDEF)-like protein
MAGDQVLKDVSALVAKLIRVEDVFARYGGEEFVLIVRGIEQKNVRAFAERVRRAVESHVVTWQSDTSQDIHVTISIGLAMLDECGDIGTAEGLLLLADERLYAAKHAGRNRVCAE